MLPKMKNLEDLSKIHLDVIKHSGFKWVMFRVSTEHQREGQRMRRREAELSVVRKPQDLWIITLKIETALSKLMEVPCKVVLLCTLFPKFALWNVFICNSNLGVAYNNNNKITAEKTAHNCMKEGMLVTEWTESLSTCHCQFFYCVLDKNIPGLLSDLACSFKNPLLWQSWLSPEEKQQILKTTDGGTRGLSLYSSPQKANKEHKK